MKNNSRYFNNTECEYYPCHRIESENTDFNCLFCFCPLYFIECPGNFKIIENNGKSIKDCMDCKFPHIPENYDKIIKILKETDRNDR